MTQSKRIYESEDEIEAVVLGFEACTTPAQDFTHQAHLTVALWYLTQHTMAEATARMRESLLRFILHHKEQGYNETITVFWLKLVGKFLDAAPPHSSLTELANELTAQCNNSRLIFDYYSKELLSSQEAKENAVEPDLRPLDF